MKNKNLKQIKKIFSALTKKGFIDNFEIEGEIIKFSSSKKMREEIEKRKSEPKYPLNYSD